MEKEQKLEDKEELVKEKILKSVSEKIGDWAAIEED
jgi:hypothetical protein